MRELRRAAIILGIVGVIVLLFWWYGNTPDSTQGVRLVGANTVRVPAGQTLVLVHTGKPRQVWKITYDGKQTVRFHCDTLLCADAGPGHVTEVGKTVGVSTNLFYHYYITLRSDGAVNVRWPWGWTYRPYKS